MDVKAQTFLPLGCLFHQIFSLIDKGENKALLMPANQSSTFYSKESSLLAVASLAVDGKTSNKFYDMSCTHTNVDLDTTWWEVDLQRMTTINHVHILNRDDLSKRLHDFVVDVLEKSSEPRKKRMCAVHPGAAGPGWVNLTCGSPSTGRYVRISKPTRHGSDALTLCEVEIYGQYEVKRHYRRPYGVKLCDDWCDQHNSSCVHKEFTVDNLTCRIETNKDEDAERKLE